MQLIDLIVMACSIANPRACQNYHIVFPWAGSLRACTLQAETRLEQWSEDHPKLHIARWHCIWPDQETEHS